MPKTLCVSPDPKNPGDFQCITDALNTIPKDNKESVTIRIAPGIYHEKITVNQPFVTLLGCGSCSCDTVLTYDDYAYFIMTDGKKRGTFRSYSVFIDAHDVTLKNLTIENASGDAAVHGQAIALYADGDRLIVDSCRILGHQDTLFTGPLPPKEIEKDGFIGPKQFAPRTNCRQYYKNCFICGNIDFIFGSASAYFENCIIESLLYTKSTPQTPLGKPDVQGYITAASTPHGLDYGYVFFHCDFISKECPPNSVYLGRPWRDYAKTVFVQCTFGKHIHPELFHDWNKTHARSSVFYAICQNHAEILFPQHAEFAHLLALPSADTFTKACVLSGTDGWMP